MKLLITGRYDINNHPRTRVIRDGLEMNGVDVEVFLPHNPFKFILKLFKKDFDAIHVTGKPWLFIASLLKVIHKKPVIFDAFISDYSSLVLDRKKVKPGTFKSRMVWLSDKYACKFADYTIFNTEENKEWFKKEFDLKKIKSYVVPLGADEKIFYPRKLKLHKKFTVVFHGTFIPIHGVEHIIRAAKILQDKKEDIQFKLIGDGQTFLDMWALATELKLKNLKFLGRLETLDDVAKEMAKAHVCLGLFGDSDKSNRVIANKVYEIIAMGKPLISGTNPSMRRIFKHRRTIEFCNLGDPADLANAIYNIKGMYNRDILSIDKNGLELFEKKFSTKKIGKQVKRILNEVAK